MRSLRIHLTGVHLSTTSGMDGRLSLSACQQYYDCMHETDGSGACSHSHTHSHGDCGANRCGALMHTERGLATGN